MKNTMLLAATVALGIGASVAPASIDTPQTVSAQPDQARVTDVLANKRFSVLTYNVEGLPFPVRSGRPAALEKIGARLADLRRTGNAPHIVVLQEAFVEEAKVIGLQAGYRYQAVGHGADVERPATVKPLPADFLAERSFAMGETIDPVMPSGLIILSDFPISGVRSVPFPKNACAGFDCLANKGVMAAMVAVPGLPRPVEVIATHLNANRASGRSDSYTRHAYDAQLQALDRFVQAGSVKPTVRIFAGDFNVGRSPGRLSALMGYIRHWKADAATAMGKMKYHGLCVDNPGQCDGDLAIKANVPLTHTTDWQMVHVPADVSLSATARQVVFGRDRTGKMLSDHLGFSVVYQFQ